VNSARDRLPLAGAEIFLNDLLDHVRNSAG